MAEFEIYLKFYLLIFVRVSAAMIFFPGFGSPVFPSQAKVLVILIISAIVAMGFPPVFAASFGDNLVYSGYVVKEILFGMVLGFVSQAPFMAAKAAGDIIGFSSMLSMATVMDPSHGTQNSVWGEFYNIMAVLIFFIINGHLMVIRALHFSFTAVPVSSALHLGPGVFRALVDTGTTVLLAGLAIAAPVMAVLFISNAAMAIISKTMPQFNIFMVGLPLQIMLAFMMIILTIGVDSEILRNLFDSMFRKLDLIIKAAGA